MQKHQHDAVQPQSEIAARGNKRPIPEKPTQSFNEQFNLLDDLLSRTSSRTEQVNRRQPNLAETLDPLTAESELDRFLSSQDLAEKLRCWFGADAIRRNFKAPKSWFIFQLQRAIAKIDRLVSSQLNAILHHADFQRLEAAWRGLNYLTNCQEKFGSAPISIRVLNVTWSELRLDLEAIEFDQSQAFKKVNEEALGQAGADPFSVILADFAIHPRPTREHPYDDMFILRSLAAVASAAICPLVINAAPKMLGLDAYDEFRPVMDLEKLHSGLEFFSWQKFRESDESRFVSVTVPRLLMRGPYRDSYYQADGFLFEEQLGSRHDYLWGGSAFAVGEVLMRAFADCRWFADIRGAQKGVQGGGLVQGPAFDEFATESAAAAAKILTEIVIDDEYEHELAKAGFLSLCACKDLPLGVFYSCPTAQKAKNAAADAGDSTRLSIQLSCMLCVSRFAHYLKVIARNKIGACSSPEQLERLLQDWLVDYVAADTEASATIKAEKPLREADVRVRYLPGRAGEYGCVIRLAPHHELDELQAAVRLDTKLVKPVQN